MPELDYQEAVQLLINHLGRQRYGLEADGRDEMERLLRDGLGYDSQQANETIDAMISAGTLRYHTSAETGGAPLIPTAASAAIGSVNAKMSGAAPGEPDETSGYWQIGHEAGEGPGRAGQVQSS